MSTDDSVDVQASTFAFHEAFKFISKADTVITTPTGQQPAPEAPPVKTIWLVCGSFAETKKDSLPTFSLIKALGRLQGDRVSTELSFLFTECL